MVSESVLPVRFRQYKEGEVSKIIRIPTSLLKNKSELDTTKKERGVLKNDSYSDTINKYWCPQKQF
jgi:hypothetical protein